AVALDGAALAPRQPEPHGLALPLPAGEGPRVLRLRWVFEEGTETLAEPNLEVPRLKDLPDAPVVWTVDVPAGHHLTRVAGAAAAPGWPGGAGAGEGSGTIPAQRPARGTAARRALGRRARATGHCPEAVLPALPRRGRSGHRAWPADRRPEGAVDGRLAARPA